jgi:hypothetical protein
VYLSLNNGARYNQMPENQRTKQHILRYKPQKQTAMEYTTSYYRIGSEPERYALMFTNASGRAYDALLQIDDEEIIFTITRSSRSPKSKILKAMALTSVPELRNEKVMKDFLIECFNNLTK